MSQQSQHRSQGVAMVLALMVTAVLSVFLLQISLSAKARVVRSQALVDQTILTLSVRSAEASLLATMLTEPWINGLRLQVDPDTVLDLSGKSFSLHGVRITVRDVGGLMSVPDPGGKADALGRLLVSLGISEAKADRLATLINEMPPPPRGLPFQDLSEIGQLIDLSPDEIDGLREHLTLYPAPTFNPAAASGQILTALYPGSIGGTLVEANAANQLDESLFTRLMASGGDEFVSFSPGPTFRIRYTAERGNAIVSQVSTVRLNPAGQDPVDLLELRYGLPWKHSR